MIVLQRSSAGFTKDEVTLAMAGMSISLVATVDHVGNKYLELRVGGVGAAVYITDSSMESWTILIRGESSQGVGVTSQDVASICVGPARNAIDKGTQE